MSKTTRTELSIEDYIVDTDPPHSISLSEAEPDIFKSIIEPIPSIPIKRFKRLNKLTNGLRPNEFSILCGSTGSGKTSLMANLSAMFSEDGVPQFVASVETGKDDYGRRMFSCFANHDYNTGGFVNVAKAQNDREKCASKLWAGNVWLSLYENRFKVETLMNDIAYHVKNHGVKVAIVDNLNFFLEVTRAADSVVEMDRVIHNLIIFCKVVPVHIIMVMHPRKSEGGRVEGMDDIKGSSTAVQEAHNVFLWNRLSPKMIEDMNDPEIVSAMNTKHRIGKYSRELKICKMRRQGKASGNSVIFHAENGVTYEEIADHEPG